MMSVVIAGRSSRSCTSRQRSMNRWAPHRRRIRRSTSADACCDPITSNLYGGADAAAVAGGGEGDLAGGHRGCRAAGGTACHACGVTRVARRAAVAVLGGEAVGVLVHVECAHQHATGGLQASYQHGIAARRRAVIPEAQDMLLADAAEAAPE